MRKMQKLKIPKSSLQEGITRSLVRSKELLSAAELLSSRCPVVASAVFSCAVEEIGKAQLLRQAILGDSDPAVIAGFWDHETKIEEARKLLPQDALLLVKGAFQAGAFQAGAFQVNVTADLLTRLESLWTDFKNGRWVGDPRVDPKRLTHSLGEVGEKLDQFREEWCS